MVKRIILILLIIILILICIIDLRGLNYSNEQKELILKTRIEKNNLIKKIKINNKSLVYDEKNQLYYCSIPEKYLNKNYILKFNLSNKYKYKIVGYKNNIIKVNYNKIYYVIIYNDKYYKSIKIQLTNLPMVDIRVDEKIDSTSINGLFTYIDKSKELNSNISIHVRGASSKYLPKKSYRINFFNNNYTQKRNVKVVDTYNGDSIILDALYRDPSKIRNTLSTNLWNKISNDFSSVKLNNQFVELFINNEYVGLYSLNVPVNRTSLNLRKTNKNNTSVVIKTNGWHLGLKNDDYDKITKKNYLDYEIRYPKKSYLYSKAWQSVLRKLSNYYNIDKIIYNEPIETALDIKFDVDYNTVTNTFNEKNYIDLIIFNSFISNIDSCMFRNTYFYMKNIDDSDIYIQPWDLEFTYGLYIYKEYLPYFEFDKIVCPFQIENGDKINKKIINRYYELRNTVLNMEYINMLLDNYANKLNNGAASRDSNLWGDYQVEYEIEKIRKWIKSRIKFFDKYVNSLK